MTEACEICGVGRLEASSDDTRMLRREIGLNVYPGATFSVGAHPGQYRRACASCYVQELRKAMPQ